MFKKLTAQSPVMAQSCTILEELMKVVLKRELELVLNPEAKPAVSLADDQGLNPNSGYSELRSTLHPSPAIPSLQKIHRSDFRISYMSESPTLQLPRVQHQAMVPPQNPPQTHDFLPQVDTFPPPYDDPASISPETYGSNQISYDFLDAEPDQGFNIAFGALERVIYDVAPGEWTNPAWMRSCEDVEPYGYATPSGGFGEGLMDLGNDGFYNGEEVR